MMNVLKRRGFTVVELLVVIGILSILAGLVLPTIRRARIRANTVRCSAQLQQIGQALAQYASDNRGHILPLASAGLIASDWPTIALRAKRDELIVCPTGTDLEKLSFSLNEWLALCRVRQGYHFRTASAAEIVLAGENPIGTNYPAHICATLNEPVLTYDPVRHGAIGSNYLWFDFHVSTTLLKRYPEANDDWDFTH